MTVDLLCSPFPYPAAPNRSGTTVVTIADARSRREGCGELGSVISFP
ncbi:MAG: hypothetical protein IH942_01860 [Acidobacteria bacterium]|nr:hypothetical protein [Acidobacteriota bacterium]